jgi:23S rRNA (pseudouridine1915-N3)-methyltransferase
VRLALFAFGKLRTPGLREAADYYASLLRPWVPLEEIELKARETQVRDEELLLERLESRLGSRGVFYLMDEGGRARPTREWAALVREWEGSSTPTIALCIGAARGFSEELRSRAHGILSLGPQTLSHELARPVLLEQLYRAWSVTRGHPYHNA